MSDFSISWTLSRQRFVDSLSGLTQAQLNWRIHTDSLTIAEMALHVAGVEISFGAQLSGADLDGLESRVRLAATDGVVNDNPFPFRPEEITPELVSQALALAKNRIEPLIVPADGEVRRISLKSALGPMIDGEGAFARLAFHPAYHQGQIHTVRTAPGFPSA